LANIINGTDTGSGGLITTGDSSDELQLQTAEVARVTLTNTAVVVNESGADVDFRVESDTVENALFVDGATGNIGIGNTGNSSRKVEITQESGQVAGVRVLSGGSGAYYQMFTGTANTKIGSSNNTNQIEFHNDSGEAMRITSDGYLRLAGGGIQFNGDTLAANALDDYEEGTFTPAFSSSGAVFAYTAQQGAYTKIGRQVCFNIYLQLDGAQTLTANFVIITGLPFTSATISGLNVAMVCGIRLVNLTAGASILVGRLGSNSSSISLVEEGDNYATTSLNSNQLSNLSGQVMISGTYPAT
jgi:hypothetical protein